MKSISVIIPAYNEAKRIEKPLRKTCSFLKHKKYDYEIIIVNDCSKDKTVDVVKRVKDKHIRVLSNKKNMGKGYTVKRGMLAAKKQWVLFTDADGSTPIEMLDRMEKFAGNYDVIIGSRNIVGSDVQWSQPWYRVLAGKSFPLMVRLVLLPGIKDTQCGFKLFKKDAALAVFKRQVLQGFAFDAELLVIAQTKGYRIKEVGVKWKNDEESKVSLVRDSYRMFRDIIRIRLNKAKGIYG